MLKNGRFMFKHDILSSEDEEWNTSIAQLIRQNEQHSVTIENDSPEMRVLNTRMNLIVILLKHFIIRCSGIVSERCGTNYWK